MEPLSQADPQDRPQLSLWKNPFAWVTEHSFSRNFWSYFLAIFCFDAGYGVFFFLFNLYLLDLGFSEKLMGWVGGAVTLGSVLVMMPVGLLSKRIGVKPLIITCFVASPIFNALRAVYIWWPAQIALALLAGATMSAGTVCYLPAVARLTTDKNRTAAFSLIISASLGAAALGGMICGYLPAWVKAAGISMHAADLKRIILLVSCAVVLLGLLPLFRLQFPEPTNEPAKESTFQTSFRRWKPSPFLLRFLPLMALWAAVVASFTPFGSVYLSSVLHMPMSQIGLVFSGIQIVQLCMGAAAPIVFRALGLVNGIVVVQAGAGIMLCALALAHDVKLAVAAYLIVSALQWMSSPGLYDLVMSKTPDRQRNTASAATLLWNSIAASVATACCGVLFARFGYPRVLFGIAALALIVAVLVWLLLTPKDNGEQMVQAGIAQPEV
ncbi:MAG TPA: MFS transporter [Acidobacteriaceae bacterium]|nr:MFS transporter [Acidobacteriaceae bacterium]